MKRKKDLLLPKIIADRTRGTGNHTPFTIVNLWYNAHDFSDP